jgi:hypothetical protein
MAEDMPCVAEPTGVAPCTWAIARRQQSHSIDCAPQIAQSDVLAISLGRKFAFVTAFVFEAAAAWAGAAARDGHV